MRRPAVVLTGCLFAAVLAAPATAAAGPAWLDAAETVRGAQLDGGSNEMFVQLVPPAIKGYHWTVLAYKRTPRSKMQLSITFSRSRAQGTQSQVSEFRWELPRGALRLASDLKPAAFDTRRGMGDNGSVDMRLTHSDGYLRAPAGDGCGGAVSFRTGRFGGRFRFNARDQYFKRISMQGVQAFVYREHDFRCEPDPQPSKTCAYQLELHAVDEDAGVAVTAMKTPEGRVDQRVVAVRDLDTGTALHTIFATLAVPEAFEASEDLTSASVDGDPAEPWLTGDLGYVGPPATEGEHEDCGPHQSSSGLVTGDYTAHFDSIGDVTIPATGMAATLRRDI